MMEKKNSNLEQDKSKQDGLISSLKSAIDKEIKDLKQEKDKMGKEIMDVKQGKSQQDEVISSLKRTLAKEIHDLKEDQSKQDDVISSIISTLSINQTYQIQPAKDVTVRAGSDENECGIRDMCQMSDGTVILLDSRNKKLKRLDDKFNVKDVYKFNKKPISVVSMSSSQVVVLDRSGKLTYLTILDTSVYEKSLALEEIEFPEYMIYCEDQFWILCRDGIYIYSSSGSFVKQISNNVTEPPFMHGAFALTTNKEKKRVYFVKESTVKVLDPNGEKLPSLQLKNAACAITFTTDDMLLVVEYMPRNVVVYDTKGNNLGVLIFDSSLLSNPNSLLYDGKKGYLIVGFKEENKVQVFQLNK